MFNRTISLWKAILVLTLTVLAAGRAASPSASLGPAGLTIESDSLVLAIAADLTVTPALRRQGSLVTPVSRPGLVPTFHVEVGGRPVPLAVDRDRLEEADIPADGSPFGKGKKFLIRASSGRVSRYDIEAEITLSFYEKFPTVYFTSAVFTNRGDSRIEVERVVADHYRLDRRLLDPGSHAWEFASYQGGAYRWSLDYALIWPGPDFAQVNFMGAGDRESAEGEGGGTPLVDLWAPGCGLAVFSAEPRPEWISLPVRTARDGLVEVCLTQEPGGPTGISRNLEPGRSLHSIEAAVMLHRLDFHDPLRTYAEILRCRGIDIQRTSPAAAHNPYWKTWGFDLNFTLGQLYAVLPQLKRIGIDWFILDDGWFDYYGDWRPSPEAGKFPDREDGMRAFVARLHREGFKADIWWCPQGMSPGSELARQHRDWVILDENGEPPVTDRGNWLLCPAYPPCVEYIASVAEKFLAGWGYDALYLDAVENTACPPCFNPAHKHASPLESFRNQGQYYRAIYEKAQQLRPGCPVEMCICGLPHDPFKMPYYNVATTSDPMGVLQMRRRVKVEKALHGPAFCITDCLQVPLDEWKGWSLPEAFESTLGTGALTTTFYRDLDPGQERKWKLWIDRDKRMGLSNGNYLNLYDIAFDKPEAHVVEKGGTLYYGFFADYWPMNRPLELRGLAPGRSYLIVDYASQDTLGTLTADKPKLFRAFKDNLLLEAIPRRE
ncbi:MAG: glycoside hydrolase family 36 protein [Candidatus Glassbacteria bacterium]